MRKKIPALCNLALVFKKVNASIWPWSVKNVMIYNIEAKYDIWYHQKHVLR